MIVVSPGRHSQEVTLNGKTPIAATATHVFSNHHTAICPQPPNKRHKQMAVWRSWLVQAATVGIEWEVCTHQNRCHCHLSYM